MNSARIMFIITAGFAGNMLVGGPVNAALSHENEVRFEATNHFVLCAKPKIEAAARKFPEHKFMDDDWATFEHVIWRDIVDTCSNTLISKKMGSTYNYDIGQGEAFLQGALFTMRSLLWWEFTVRDIEAGDNKADRSKKME